MRLVFLAALVVATTIVNLSPKKILSRRRRRRLQHLDPKTIEEKEVGIHRDAIVEDSVDRVRLPIYTQENIELTAKHFYMASVPRILVFDGENFQLYNLEHKSTLYVKKSGGWRSNQAIPLLVNALKEIDPDRFQPGQPPFQLLYTDGDCLASKICHEKKCPVDQFAPFLVFGSVPMDDTRFPSVQAFPNAHFIDCLERWKLKGRRGACKWGPIPNPEEKHPEFQQLKNQIVWRGTLNNFLGTEPEFLPTNDFLSFQDFLFKEVSDGNTYDSLISTKEPRNWARINPRMRAVIMTLEDEFLRQNPQQQYPGLSSLLSKDPWIDAKFPGEGGLNMRKAFQQKGLNVTGEYMSPMVQMNYKYLIDFGGGGGTTWKGTIDKLNLPGLLMHHETSMKDWYFELLKPMVNCLPVAWDLSNLKDQYIWAEDHPEEAKKIAEEGTKLGNYLLSEEYMSKLYNDLFVKYLKEVLTAYHPLSNNEQDSWSTLKSRYENNGYRLTLITACEPNCRIIVK